MAESRRLPRLCMALLTLACLMNTCGTAPVTPAHAVIAPALPSVLWIGPWYDPAQPFTATSAVQDYGVGAVMYDLDWLDGNYDSLRRPVHLSAYVAFAEERIREAHQAHARLWFSTLTPFTVGANSWQVLRQLAPIFRDPSVLGMALPDEPASISSTVMTPASEAAGVSIFHALFPGKLTWQNTRAGDSLLTQPWVGIGDVFSQDYYPPTLASGWQATYTAEARMIHTLAGGRPAYMIHGVFDSTLSWCQPRTPAALRAMDAIAHQYGEVDVWWGAWLDPDHAAPPSVRQFRLGQPAAPSAALRATVRQIGGQ